MTERRLTLSSTLSFSGIRVCMCMRTRACVGSAGIGRFVSQFLIGLETLNVRLYSAERRCTDPNLASSSSCCSLLHGIPTDLTLNAFLSLSG